MKSQAKQIALLLGLAVGLALCVNFFSPVGIALVGRWDISKGVITAGAKNDAVTDDLEIDDVKNARQIFNSGAALFVDARTRESYEEGHIPRAVSFPVGEFDMHIEAFMNRHSPEQPIVTPSPAATPTPTPTPVPAERPIFVARESELAERAGML